MARPIWSGVISFGLVSVPVGMYSATREHEVSFHQFQRGTSDRIRYQRINERTGKEVDFGDIVKGVEVGGEYVMVEPDELDEIAPGRSRSLEIHRFVDLDTIDPMYYQKTYYLGPGSEETSKTYALLRDAMAEANKAAIGTLVMRGKEYLTAIRPDGPLLVLETMFFADEVRDPKEVLDGTPGRAKARPEEMKMASQLIDSMTGDWDPNDYRDTYTDRVKKLIKAKQAGREVTVAEQAPEPTGAKDLMEVLRRSIEAARPGAKKAPAKKAAAKRAPATKATAKRAPATKATAKRAPATKAAAKRAPATKAAAKKTAAKKAPAKKAATKKAPAKKASTTKRAKAKKS
ncbi:Ku protein [Allorhizocola rhizosphaerae]|uniref:non-homologous end joining protein Ku n=1 Tax=Allorhizocola rhizosphaerae TaxID=1872709 RepID=UPI000E3E40B6|nr:Ku protein [Allorhizocola rhizosphaerae]